MEDNAGHICDQFFSWIQVKSRPQRTSYARPGAAVPSANPLHTPYPIPEFGTANLTQGGVVTLLSFLAMSLAFVVIA